MPASVLDAAPASGDPSGRPQSSEDVPLRALGLSLGALAVAATVSLLWPASVAEYAGLVWILALVPVHLLSYYRGWRGAVLATTLTMVVFVGAQLVNVAWLDQRIEWWVYGVFAFGLAVASLGSGSLAEALLRSRARALELASLDPLTKLANRRLLRSRGEEALATADRSGGVAGLVFLDLVRFKRINDSMGHLAGDRVLQTVADRLRDHVRDGDLPARVGGDEFAVLLPALADEENALAVARRLKQVFRPAVKVEDQRVHVEARVGVALYPGHAEDFDQLLSRASATQHQLKLRSERDVAFYRTIGREGPRQNDLELEEDLLATLREEELDLRFQPIFPLEGGRPAAAETLVVWEHPEHGTLPAADFVPLAVQAGFIRELDRQVLRSAVRQAAEWSRRGTLRHVSVNLSPGSLADPGLPSLLAELLADADLPEGFLVLEITEEIALRSPEETESVLAELESLGVLLALDDFGSGYSSFAHLARLPIHWLKVDRTLVDDLASDEKRQRMMEGVIALGRGLDLEVVAEGVETRGQLGWLRGTACAYVQGYHLGRPGPAGTIADAAFSRESA